MIYMYKELSLKGGLPFNPSLIKKLKLIAYPYNLSKW